MNADSNLGLTAFAGRGVIEANYAIQPNIGIFCRLEPLDSHEEAFLAASVGIRQHRDTRLALGAKLNLLIKNPADNQLDIYSTKVVRIQRKDNLDLHILEQPIFIPREEAPEKPHVEIKVRAFLPEQFSMKDVLVSQDGLKFIYNSTLTSAKIGKIIPVYLDCSEKTPFECRVSHILYNWWTNTHVVTAGFESLNERQNEILSRMIKPEEVSYGELPLPVENLEQETVAAVTESVTVYPGDKGSMVNPATGKIQITGMI